MEKTSKTDSVNRVEMPMSAIPHCTPRRISVTHTPHDTSLCDHVHRYNTEYRPKFGILLHRCSKDIARILDFGIKTLVRCRKPVSPSRPATGYPEYLPLYISHISRFGHSSHVHRVARKVRLGAGTMIADTTRAASTEPDTSPCEYIAGGTLALQSTCPAEQRRVVLPAQYRAAHAVWHREVDASRQK